jgi:hypothetical protein
MHALQQEDKPPDLVALRRMRTWHRFATAACLLLAFLLPLASIIYLANDDTPGDTASPARLLLGVNIVFCLIYFTWRGCRHYAIAESLSLSLAPHQRQEEEAKAERHQNRER